MQDMRRDRTIILFALTALSLSLAAGTTATGSERQWISCEVLEASPPVRGDRPWASRTQWILLHHARPADRGRLSRWLRSRSGTVVTFKGPGGRIGRGVLYRLNRCFGRGLLLFEGALEVHSGSLVEIALVEERTGVALTPLVFPVGADEAGGGSPRCSPEGTAARVTQSEREPVGSTHPK
jgi:hypothetical protein